MSLTVLSNKYNAFAQTVKPVCMVAGFAAGAYVAYNNPTVVIEGVNLFCRTIGVGVTANDLNNILMGHGMKVASGLVGFFAGDLAGFYGPRVLALSPVWIPIAIYCNMSILLHFLKHGLNASSEL